MTGFTVCCLLKIPSSTLRNTQTSRHDGSIVDWGVKHYWPQINETIDES